MGHGISMKIEKDWLDTFLESRVNGALLLNAVSETLQGGSIKGLRQRFGISKVELTTNLPGKR